MNEETSYSANETIARLNETLNRYTASTLTNVTIPEFGGLPNEDVSVFLKRFKVATLTFSEELRCLALNKALVGSAHTWAKANIKNLLLTGAWKEIKKKIIERFSPPDRELRYQEKLNKLKYESVRGTLISYAEEYVDTYKKAYGKVNDQDVIRSLSLNLPTNIIRHLNTLSDDWQQFSTLPALYTLLRRIEYKIIPYEPKEIEEKIGTEAIAKLLKELKQSIETHRDKSETKEAGAIGTTEAIAAFGKPSNNLQFRNEDNGISYNKYGPYRRDFSDRYRYNRRYGGSNSWQPHDKQQWRNNSRNQQNYAFTEHGSQPNRLLPNPEQMDLKSAYMAKHGVPPAPCPICKDNHFRRHCPYQNLN